jgi:hypothetical protein
VQRLRFEHRLDARGLGVEVARNVAARPTLGLPLLQASGTNETAGLRE